MCSVLQQGLGVGKAGADASNLDKSTTAADATGASAEQSCGATAPICNGPASLLRIMQGQQALNQALKAAKTTKQLAV